MADDPDDLNYPRLLSVEEFASRVILASMSGLFLSLFILLILQIQVISITLNPNFLGPFLTILIVLILAFVTPKIYRLGVLFFGSYWLLARRDDFSIEDNHDNKITLFFVGFTLLGMSMTYVVNRMWIEVFDLPDSTLLSAYQAGIDPFTMANLVLMVLAHTGSIAFTIAAGYTTLFRLKLRFFPDYFCPECGKEIEKDFTRCPYCEKQIEAPVNRRPYFRVPFGEDE